MSTFAIPNEKNGSPAEVAQLVEHNLAKVGVASSSLVFRSNIQNQGHLRMTLILEKSSGSKKNLPDEVSIICSRPLSRRLFCLYPLHYNISGYLDKK